MKLKFIRPQSQSGTAKCTIHKNGKLGFSQAAVDRLNIKENTYVKIAVNEEDTSDVNLYMLVVENESNDTFKISKAGNYFYVNTKLLFDELQVDYKKKKIIYDIVEIEHEGEKIYKLVRRMLDRNKK